MQLDANEVRDVYGMCEHMCMCLSVYRRIESRVLIDITNGQKGKFRRVYTHCTRKEFGGSSCPCIIPEILFIPCLRLLIFEISIAPIDTVPSPITHSIYIDLIFGAGQLLGAVYSPLRSAQSNFPCGQTK